MKKTGVGKGWFAMMLTAAAAAVVAVWQRHGPKVLIEKDAETGIGAYRTGKSRIVTLEVQPLLWCTNLLKSAGSWVASPFVRLYRGVTSAAFKAFVVKAVIVLVVIGVFGGIVWLMVTLGPCPCSSHGCGQRTTENPAGLCRPPE